VFNDGEVGRRHRPPSADAQRHLDKVDGDRLAADGGRAHFRDVILMETVRAYVRHDVVRQQGGAEIPRRPIWRLTDDADERAVDEELDAVDLGGVRGDLQRRHADRLRAVLWADEV